MVASDDIEVRSLQAIRNEQTKTIFSKYGVSISFSEQGVLKLKGDEQSLDVFEPQPLKAKYVLLLMVPQNCDNTDAINSNGRYFYVFQLVEQDGAEASLVRGFEIVLDKYESAQSLFDLLDKWKSKKGKENVSYCIAAVKYFFDVLWTEVLEKWTRAESRVPGKLPQWNAKCR